MQTNFGDATLEVFRMTAALTAERTCSQTTNIGLGITFHANADSNNKMDLCALSASAVIVITSSVQRRGDATAFAGHNVDR